MKRWPVIALTILLKSYQLFLSPFLGRNCRFHPSCSHYAIEAITTHGAIYGFWLTCRRLGRCHPFHPGGNDPVPPRGKKKGDAQC
jgi:putative membrane protein insertion efficiency factor